MENNILGNYSYNYRKKMSIERFNDKIELISPNSEENKKIKNCELGVGGGKRLRRELIQKVKYLT